MVRLNRWMLTGWLTMLLLGFVPAITSAQAPGGMLTTQLCGNVFMWLAALMTPLAKIQEVFISRLDELDGGK